MTIDEVLKYYDGVQAKACHALGLPRQYFTKWIDRGHIPYVHQLVFEKITGGKLVAENSRLIKHLKRKEAAKNKAKELEE